MALNLTLNGEARLLPEMQAGASLADLVAHLELAADRIALEHNGVIAARQQWAATPLADGDRLEMVHFVGGGSR